MAGMVIIGAGHAAGQAAASLRQEKYEGPITIIGDESPRQRGAGLESRGAFRAVAKASS